MSEFLARDVIYTSRAYAMMPVCLSVTEVHWRIIANLGFKFRSHFTAIAAAVLLAGESSLAMLASARLSCYDLQQLNVGNSHITIWGNSGHRSTMLMAAFDLQGMTSC